MRHTVEMKSSLTGRQIGHFLITMAALTAIGMFPDLVWDLLPDRPWSWWWSVVGIVILLGLIGIAAKKVVPWLRGLGPFERIVKLDKAPRATILVLPLARPDDVALQGLGDALSMIGDDGTIDQLVAATSSTPWEVPAQVLRQVCADGQVPQHVLLIGSRDDKKGEGSAKSGVTLQDAIRRCLPPTTEVSMLEVDMMDIEGVRTLVKERVDVAMAAVQGRSRSDESPTVVFDATAGTKPVSIALAMLTMDDSHTFVYWLGESPGRRPLEAYDVRVRKSGDSLSI